MDDLARAFAMERRFDQRLSTRIAPFAFGTAFFDDHHRDRFVSNFLNVEGDLDAVEPDDLMHSADEILGSAGYAHRMVLVRSVVRKGPLCQAGFSLDFAIVALMTCRRDQLILAPSIPRVGAGYGGASTVYRGKLRLSHRARGSNCRSSLA